MITKKHYFLTAVMVTISTLLLMSCGGDDPNSPCSVSITSPSPGAVWTEGQQREIQWTTGGSCGPNVEIALFKGSNSSRLGTIVSPTPNDGSFSWTVDDCGGETAADYYISVHDLSTDTWCPSGNFTITVQPCACTVTSPTAGVPWTTGESRTITWTISGSCGPNVEIALFSRSVPGRVGTIATSTPNDGSHQWSPVDEFGGGTADDYYISIHDLSTDTWYSSGNFGITVPPCACTVTSPSTGVTWTKGELRIITWDISGSCGPNVEIALFSRSVPGRVGTIATSTPNDGSYQWNPVDEFGGGTADDYYISIHDLSTDTWYSSDNFTIVVTIQPPHIVLNRTTMDFSAVQSSSLPSCQTFTIMNSGDGTLNWAISESCSWLNVSPVSGNSNNTTITVCIATTQLNPGTYYCTVIVSSSNADNSPRTIAVSYTVTAPVPHIVLSRTTMSFSAVQNSSIPGNQTFTITNSGGGTLNWNVSDNASWLSLSPTSGNNNSQTITVWVNTTNLDPDTYNGTITVASSNADNSPQTIAVSYTVTTQPPHIVLSRTTMSFSAVQNGSEPGNQTFTITNSGGGTLNWRVSDNAIWLTVEPPGPENSNSQTITVSVNTTNLSPNTYNGTITVSSSNADNSPQTIAVDYTVTPPADLCLSQNTWNAPPGGGTSPSITVNNCGNSETISYSISDDAGWLTENMIDNTTPGSFTITATANNTGSSRTGHVTVSSSGLTSKTVTVTQSSTNPELSVSTNVINMGTGGSSGVVNITNSGDGTLTWDVSDNRDWITVSHMNGSTTTEVDQITVSVDRSGLSPDDYSGTVTIASNGGTETVTINMTVAGPECSVSPTNLNFGDVEVGQAEILPFTICNTGSVTFSGSVSESSSQYSIWSGGGSYTLSPGQCRTVQIRFAPTSLGTKTTTISTGAECSNVSCTGRPYEIVQVSAPLVADAGVLNLFPNTNYGLSADVTIANDGGAIAYGYYLFNVNGVPDNAEVTWAVLNLYVEYVDAPSGIKVYRASSSWAETTITFNNASSYFPTPVSLPSPPGSSGYTWGVRVEDLVQYWVDGSSNYGFNMRLSSGTVAFASKQSPSNPIPQLLIQYKQY